MAGRLGGIPLFGPLLTAIVDELRGRVFRIELRDVLTVAEQLDRAGLVWMLVGGWGIDALLGRQTRRHEDLDVAVEWADDGERRAIEALAGLGYSVTAPRSPGSEQFPARAVLRRADGRTVDLLVVTALDAPQRPHAQEAAYVPHADRATGHLGGHEVPCLSAARQVAAHEGYRLYAAQRRDLAALSREFGIPMPPVSALGDLRLPFLRLADAAGRRMARRWSTALVVEVPEANAILVEAGMADMAGMPAHVTIAYPFVPAPLLRDRHLARLAAIARAQPLFTTRFERIGRLPDSWHLVPDDPAPWQRLAHDVRRQWPGLPRGHHEGPIHLTIAYLDNTAVPRIEPQVRKRVRALLPLTMDVAQLTLLEFDRRRGWQVQARFPLAER